MKSKILVLLERIQKKKKMKKEKKKRERESSDLKHCLYSTFQIN